MRRPILLAVLALIAGLLSVLSGMRTTYIRSVPRVVSRKYLDTLLVYREPNFPAPKPSAIPLVDYLRPVVRDTERVAILPDSTGRVVDRAGHQVRLLTRESMRELIALSTATPIK